MTDKKIEYDYSPIQAIAFLRSCIRSGEQLSADDDADIDRTIAALKFDSGSGGKTKSEPAVVDLAEDLSRMTGVNPSTLVPTLSSAYRRGWAACFAPIKE